MKKRPLSVTLIGILYICVGIVGIAYHSREFRAHIDADAVVAVLVRSAAIVAGAFMLAGKNWARWLAVAWISFHVVLSAFHTIPQLVMHSLLLVVITFFLLRPRATGYFRNGSNPTSENRGH